MCHNGAGLQRAWYNRDMPWKNLTIAIVLLTAATTAHAAARVEFDIQPEQGLNPAVLQQWNAFLGGLGLDGVRIGNAVGGAKVDIETNPGVGGASYRVFGVLTRRSELMIPNGRFALGDRAGLGTWIQNLRTAGPPRAPGEKAPPFGLKPEVLDVVRRDLGRAADFTTLGRTPVEVLNDLGNRVAYPIVAEPTVATTLGRGEKVPGELKGLACGTVTAAVLRREGLSLIPRAGGDGRPEYYITKAARDQDVWPVGWVPERPIPELLPDLFTLRNVQVDDIPASQLLQVVAERLKLPMLFDEQALVLKNLDPSKVKVNIKEGKLGYEAVLDRAMFQASLKHEVRIDDAGRPFLWITSRQQ